ncbi:MAG: DUF1254 domain-containing protein [Candidatus Brocadiales bacterium]|nr:DUF1254 domain-containing protein [Candidatus Bathyanammoxibius amoris]
MITKMTLGFCALATMLFVLSIIGCSTAQQQGSAEAEKATVSSALKVTPVEARATGLSAAPTAAQEPSAQEAYEVGVEAYIYLYPLVLMDVTRLQMTNFEEPKGIFGLMGTFVNAREFLDVNFKTVVRPNFDTLYSSLWMDLTKEPMIVSIPDSQGRYYLAPALDMWTDVTAAPGKRTTGTKAGHFAYVPPGWDGELPEGVTRIDATTKYMWMILRTQTDGPKDYDNVHKFQNGLKATPLSQWGKTPAPAKGVVDPNVDMKTPPMKQVQNMSAKQFFEYAARLMKLHSPHATDYSQVWRLRRIGLVPGKDFDFDKLDPTVQNALAKVPADALKTMQSKIPTLARVANGWIMSTDTMGSYGIYYLKRAVVALIGLGANQVADAVYPLMDGNAGAGDRFILHFDKKDLPPVEAFWSLTLYDKDGFPVANPLNRFAIGDRDALKYNADGSLDLYFQADSPGKDKESNWLPTPKEGAWNLTMRLYAPKQAVLDGTWNPPALKRVGGGSITDIISE